MASALAEWNDKTVFVITSDGRTIMGTLAGYDQLQNLILKNANERVYHFHTNAEDDEEDGGGGSSAVEIVPLGLYVIRGDNVAVISDVREEVLKEEDAGNLSSGEAIKPVMQFAL